MPRLQSQSPLLQTRPQPRARCWFSRRAGGAAAHIAASPSGTLLRSSPSRTTGASYSRPEQKGSSCRIWGQNVSRTCFKPHPQGQPRRGPAPLSLPGGGRKGALGWEGQQVWGLICALIWASTPRSGPGFFICEMGTRRDHRPYSSCEGEGNDTRTRPGEHPVGMRAQHQQPAPRPAMCLAHDKGSLSLVYKGGDIHAVTS